VSEELTRLHQKLLDAPAAKFRREPMIIAIAPALVGKR